VLAALAAYGFVVVVVGGYPFERIKHLGDHQKKGGDSS
jgi:hypothetical protein